MLRGQIHFDDLTGACKYSPMVLYAKSKFAKTLYSDGSSSGACARAADP